jgi:exodeoxyribonuclease VII large subunit
VWQDIQNVVRRRYPLVELALVPCQVQGDNAVPTIIEAFHVVDLEPDIDAVILARGGGSMEELWPFNDEAVARAIYASRRPVISAVGHETDVTLADLVADLRAPTPSAAAELVVPDSRELRAGVAAHGRSLYRGMMQFMAEGAGDVRGMMQRLARRAPDTAARRQQVDDLLHRAAGGLRGATALARERVRGVEGRLLSLDPSAVLRRGYAVVCRGADGTPVTSTRQVAPGDPLHVQVADGSFEAAVTGDGDGMSEGGATL